MNHIIPPRMASYTPLNLHVVLHDLPLLYSQRLRQFNGERGYSAKEHLEWFSDWKNLEEVDHDNVKVKLFAQFLAGEERRWFTNLPYHSILNYQAFKDTFKDKMGRQEKVQFVFIPISFHEEEGE